MTTVYYIDMSPKIMIFMHANDDKSIVPFEYKLNSDACMISSFLVLVIGWSVDCGLGAP